MIDDRNDPNRPLSSDPYDPYAKRRGATESAGMGWGIPLAVAAAIIVGGLLFYNTGRAPDRTATNNTPPVTQTNPSGPARTAPAPQPAPAR